VSVPAADYLMKPLNGGASAREFSDLKIFSGASMALD
jgi:hypothetical protein